jgi:hypothetical protein
MRGEGFQKCSSARIVVAEIGARWRAESEIIACLAGPAAQKRFAPSSWRSYHGSVDHRRAHELAMRLSEDDEQMARAHLNWLQLRADRFVALEWRLVEAVAAALLDRGTLSAEEIENVIHEVVRAGMIAEAGEMGQGRSPRGGL